MNPRAFLGAAVFALTVLAGCDTATPEEIELNDVVRSFTAEIFTTTTGGSVTDQLARGATVTITLNSNQTTTGRLFVPGGGEGGGNLDLSLTGTFSFDDTSDAIVFTHSADTFLRDMTFIAGRVSGRLSLTGEEAFGGTTVRVVLR